MRGSLLIKALCLWLLIPPACSLGPTVMRADRAGYNASVQQSDGQELLLNLVRTRYHEPPFFMNVSSISSSFSFRYYVGAPAEFNSGPTKGFEAAYPYNVVKPDLNVTYGEDPTITYTPLQGEKYVTQLLTEIDSARFWRLLRGGWPVDQVMGILVKQFGYLQNPESGKITTPELLSVQQDFNRILAELGRIQEKGDMQFVPELTEQGEILSITMQVRFGDDAEAEAFERLFDRALPRLKNQDNETVMQIRLVPQGNFLTEFKTRKDALDISVELRNFLETMKFLSWGVEVPQSDLDRGRAEAPRTLAGMEDDPRCEMKTGLVVKTGAEPPDNAYLAARYRGRWYYIEDSDIESKNVFGFLTALMALESGDIKAVTPVLTIPVGR